MQVLTLCLVSRAARVKVLVCEVGGVPQSALFPGTLSPWTNDVRGLADCMLVTFVVSLGWSLLVTSHEQ